MKPQKFWIHLACPACTERSYTWVEDNGDGKFYEGDTFICDRCETSGSVVAFEDGSFELSPTETEEKR